jgi:hypothetical protein
MTNGRNQITIRKGLEADIDFAGPALCEPDALPEMIGHWRYLHGETLAALRRVEAEYRVWRAQATANVLETDPKLAEWKVKAKVDLDPMYSRYKEATAVATKNEAAVRGMLDAYTTVRDLWKAASD